LQAFHAGNGVRLRRRYTCTNANDTRVRRENDAQEAQAFVCVLIANRRLSISGKPTVPLRRQARRPFRRDSLSELEQPLAYQSRT
jgi:hypothetical protein